MAGGGGGKLNVLVIIHSCARGYGCSFFARFSSLVAHMCFLLLVSAPFLFLSSSFCPWSEWFRKGHSRLLLSDNFG